LLTVLYILIMAILSLLSGIQPGAAGPTAVPPSEPAAAPVKITVLYDDHALRTDLRADHGFSCLVEGFEQTVLFDTGSSGDILMANMAALGVDPGAIDAVVLSHAHSDHTGGLAAVLARNPGVTVYFPGSFSQTFVRSVETAGARPVAVNVPTVVCPGVTVTAPLGDSPAEVGLVVRLPQGAAQGGAVLITGCAHPGLVTMAEAAAQLGDGSLYAVLGGFHLLNTSAEKVRTIIAGLQRLGVQRCGPAHCTGNQATALMQDAFGSGLISMGVGAVVVMAGRQ
jgi:7,8-dihydropterin-6-yl-methyl-4-(beta-D-ribofuranosyl)aminobenzene 5'-phosphate synthase